MQVHHILKSKADDAVVTVAPDTSLKEAAKILAERRIGTVIVSQDGQVPDGIVSERDIVRVLANRGASCLEQTVADIMTRKLVTCDRAQDADVVLSEMTNGHFRHMPVLEDGRLVGLITLGDVVKARLSEVKMEKDALEGMLNNTW